MGKSKEVMYIGLETIGAVLIISWLGYKISKENTDGDYNFNFMPIIYLVGIIITILLWIIIKLLNK